MYISRVFIRNFRNFHSATFSFSRGINTVIGENSSGKTNFFHAIRLILDDALPIRSRRLEEKDFCREVKNWQGHWIAVCVEFDELDTTEEEMAISCHGVGHMAEGTRKGTCTYIFRPNKLIRKRLFEFSSHPDKDKEKFLALQKSISIDDYEPVFLCRGVCDFTDQASYNKHVGDFERLEFPDPDELDEDELGAPPPRIFAIHEEIAFTFIKALRDVQSEFKTTRTNPLLRILRGASKSVGVSTGQDLVSQVKKLNTDIAATPEIKSISSELSTTMEETVGRTFAPQIEIASELPEDLDSLLQTLALWVADSGDGPYRGQIQEMSLGGANLIYLSMKLLEYERKIQPGKLAHILVVEEPEAHIHTHVQKTLFGNIQSSSTQVIVSTHSTHISAASKISSCNILARKGQKTEVYQPWIGLSKEEIAGVERYLDAIRSTLLFAKGVMLVEGHAEQILVPSLIQAVFGVSPDELGVSVISMDSAVFTHIANLFHDARINRRCAIISDSDKPFVSLPDDSKNDSDFQKKQRRSYEAGITRVAELHEFAKNNQWIGVFLSDYTFEVDLLFGGLDAEIKLVLHEIYSVDSYRRASAEKLVNPDREIAGEEILRIADKCGKGWLALMLSSKLTAASSIPAYILEALSFASKEIVNIGTYGKILRYRLDKMVELGYAEYFKFIITNNLKSMDEKSLIAAYTMAFPDDPATVILRNHQIVTISSN